MRRAFKHSFIHISLIASFAGFSASAKATAPADASAISEDASAISDVAASGIVSLDLCVDWMLGFFAQANQVAALSPIHPKYPSPLLAANPAAANWHTHDGSLEAIVHLAPKKILVSQYNAWTLRERLKQLDFSVVVFDHPQTLAAIDDYQRHFLRELNLPESRAHLAPPPRPARADNARLLVLGENGIGQGRGTFEDTLLTHAGWRNYLIEEGNINLDIEQLAQDPPEAILFSAPQTPALANQFADQPALKKRIAPARWIASDYWRWMCPGPWTWDLIEQLASIELPND